MNVNVSLNNMGRATVALIFVIVLLPAVVVAGKNDYPASPVEATYYDEATTQAPEINLATGVEPEKAGDPDPPAEITYQDEAEAIAQDTELLAKETGHPIKLIRNSLAFQRAFNTYGQKNTSAPI